MGISAVTPRYETENWKGNIDRLTEVSSTRLPISIHCRSADSMPNVLIPMLYGYADIRMMALVYDPTYLKLIVRGVLSAAMDLSSQTVESVPARFTSTHRQNNSDYNSDCVYIS